LKDKMNSAHSPVVALVCFHCEASAMTIAAKYEDGRCVREGKIEIQYGKTDNARRRIPMTPRVQAILDMRLSKAAGTQQVFPAPTKSGHMESSTVKQQHAKAIQEAT